jgi:HK97 gp10 family phage protein
MAEVTQVKGLRELGLAMRALGADMAGKIARQATAAGAGVARKAIKARAPRDSGNLAAAIVMKRVRNTPLSEEYVVVVRKGKTRDAKAAKRGQGKLGKDAFYAGFNEFGTVKMPAQPFVRPGFEGSLQPATQAIANRLKQRIAKVRGK